MERKRPLQQVYEHYTPEDFTVWKTLFQRQAALLKDYGSSAFLKALSTIGFNEEEIPRFETINERLAAFTGWKLKVVQGHVPAREFFEMLGEKIFPATCWLRTMAELDYIEEPDMFHDVFGHIPLLVNEAYSDFMQSFGQLALRLHDDPDAVEMLSRIYWFTIEFGLIIENGAQRIYGAGILSSPGETKFSMGEQAVRQQFKTRQVLNTAFRTDIIQEQYFVIEDFPSLNTILLEVEANLRTCMPDNRKIIA